MRKALVPLLTLLIGSAAGCAATGTPSTPDVTAAVVPVATAVTTTTSATGAADTEAADTEDAPDAAPAATVRSRRATATARTAPAPAVTITRPVPQVSCASVAGALVYGSEQPYAAYPSGISLTQGVWTRRAERLEAQRPCATGTLENHDGTVTVASLMWSTTGTTGRWWALALCTPGPTRTRCSVQEILDDREPIQSITLTGGDAVVVYLTRTPEVPAAGVNVRRTAVYHYHVNSLVQTSFTDEPYTP